MLGWPRLLAERVQSADCASKVLEHPPAVGAPPRVAGDASCRAVVELAVQVIRHLRADLAAVPAVARDRVQCRCHTYPWLKY